MCFFPMQQDLHSLGFCTETSSNQFVDRECTRLSMNAIMAKMKVAHTRCKSYVNDDSCGGYDAQSSFFAYASRDAECCESRDMVDPGSTL